MPTKKELEYSYFFNNILHFKIFIFFIIKKKCTFKGNACNIHTGKEVITKIASEISKALVKNNIPTSVLPSSSITEIVTNVFSESTLSGASKPGLENKCICEKLKSNININQEELDLPKNKSSIDLDSKKKKDQNINVFNSDSENHGDDGGRASAAFRRGATLEGIYLIGATATIYFIYDSLAKERELTHKDKVTKENNVYKDKVRKENYEYKDKVRKEKFEFNYKMLKERCEINKNTGINTVSKVNDKITKDFSKPK